MVEIVPLTQPPGCKEQEAMRERQGEIVNHSTSLVLTITEPSRITRFQNPSRARFAKCHPFLLLFVGQRLADQQARQWAQVWLKISDASLASNFHLACD